MINTDDLCMSCMKEIGNVKQCPHCDFLVDSPQGAPYLPIRTVVNNRYLVGKMLEFNGEGATYIGWDLTNRVAISIREFLPGAISVRTQGSLGLKALTGFETSFRECCQSFLEMWRQLARLRGLSALINVIDIVEDYGTAYAISENFEGAALRDFLLNSKTGYLSWEKARQLLMPVLSTLGTLHSSGIIHRGISPITLLIGRDGKIKISGFSIWQARTEKGELTPQLFSGYAAIEQYGLKGKQGVWTDIYAFAAVLYRALIGSDPLDAPSRLINDKLMVPAKFAEQIPAYVINALINALQIKPDNRTHTVEQLRAELSASPSAAVAGEVYTKTPKPEPPPAAVKTKNTKKFQEKDKAIAIKAGLISLAAGLFVFIILLATVFKDSFFNGGTTAVTTSNIATTAVEIQFTVPDFTKLGTYPEISSNPVWTDKFTFVAEEVFSSKVKTGVIISQSVKADTVVEKGATITFQVSKGKEMILLPDITGTDYTAAEEALKTIGFKFVKLDKINDGTNPPNTIFAVSPIVGKQYEKGTTIYLQVWTDPATTLPGETTTAIG
ncbi:MAG: PASTA domain-containing protein [Eubacteriales bacterium]